MTGEQTRGSEASYAQEEVLRGSRAPAQPEVGDPGVGEKLNHRSVNKHFVPIDQWGQEVQLIICEVNKKKKKIGGGVL